MDFQLQPLTKPGHRFLELAEEHAAEIATRAETHDREGTFPVEAFEAMKASGFLAAPVPEVFGGLGLDSAHDLAVGLNRLARADGSSAIAANMHLSFALVATRLARGAREAGDDETAATTEDFLGLLGDGSVAMANATEPGTDLRHPLTEATRVEEGWAISGRKIFGTLSPIADVFFVPARTARADGSYGRGFALVFRDTPGQQILENWDALGMRASGSHDVIYDNCVVPENLFTAEERWGEESALDLIIATAGNIGLVASFLGIAETARDLAVDMARTRRKAPSGRVIGQRPGIQRLVAEMEVALSTCRAMLHVVGTAIDTHVCRRPVAEVTIDELRELNKEFQSTKLVVNRAAIDVVDRALTVSGGAGYLTASPLSRLYRDVRAGPFMQPLSPAEADEYIAKVALGFEPVFDV